MLTSMEGGYGDLVREALKGAPVPRLAEVLRRLVNEGVPVTNLRAVLESVAEWGPREANNAVLAEHARVALRRYICHGLAGIEKTLTVVLVDGSLDEALRGTVHATPTGAQLNLDQATADRLVASLRGLLSPTVASGERPAVLCSLELRRHLAALLTRRGLRVPVLSHGEVAPEFSVQIAGTLRQPKLAAVAA